MYSFPDLEPVCCFMSSFNCCFLTCVQIFLGGRSGGLVFSKLLQLCLTLCYPMDCSPLGSSVHEISQARIQSGVPFLSPEDLPDQGSNLCLLYLLHWPVGSLSLASPGKPQEGHKYQELGLQHLFRGT